MAHYDLHLSEVPLEFSIDSKLRSLATNSVDLHTFEDELTLISKYADEYGHSPRNKIDSDCKGLDENALEKEKNKSTQIEHPFESTKRNNRAGSDMPRSIPTDEDFTMDSLGDGGKCDALTSSDRQQEGGVSNPPPVYDEGESPVVLTSQITSQDMTTVVPVIVGSANDDSEAGAIPEDAVKAVPTVVGNEIAANSEVPNVTVATRHGKGEEVNEVTESIRTSEGGISTSTKEALAAVEHAKKNEDAELALLMERDDLVSQMVSNCNISREECAFYLESTDWNLEDAIRIYDSFVSS